VDKNLLYYGDNLEVLRLHVEDESVDLVYLDPPFNSNRNYNVIFAHHDVYEGSEGAQIEAFGDTWHWTPETEVHYKEAVSGGIPAKAADALTAMQTLLGENDAMAYLVNMAPRLVELHRVLKPTGSLYLHCDPTMSHYLKILLDSIFDARNFKSEVVWKRSTAHSDARQGRKQHGHIHDALLYYTKSAEWTWNQIYTPHDPAYVASKYPYTEEATGRRYGLWDMTGPGGAAKGNPSYEVMGVTRYWRYSRESMADLMERGLVIQPSSGAVPRQKRYLDESSGIPIQVVWTDIDPINSQAAERLGYPTQKPEKLLERILEASSDEGDVVLDPFCGCGTTVAVAQRIGRRWIGIDITYIAVDLIEKRLQHTFAALSGTYTVQGIPHDALAAQALFDHDPLDFERWAVSRVNGTPNEKQVGDKGVDGVIRFFTDAKGGTGRALVSVKGGKTVGPNFVRDLLGTVETQKAAMGVLVTITEPTAGMKDAAAHAGTYTWPVNAQAFPRIQMFTVADLLAGRRPQMPPTLTPYIAAKRLQPPKPDQTSFDLVPGDA
jgi:DNA modification methylase